jgi:predicted SAM-dependent methyltransferase
MGSVRYADHLDTAGLREKYADDANVDIDKIVDIDVVLGAQTLPEAVGDMRFDYVIASHVIEHVPDVVGWLRGIAAVLKPGGILSLAIPDKRFTFDALRQVTTFACLVESHFLDRRCPGFREVLDHAMNAVTVPNAVSMQALWRGDMGVADLPYEHPGLIEELGEEGLRSHFEQINAGRYIDVHVHVFTPASFINVITSLARVGMLDFRMVAFFPTKENDMEFFVSLERLPQQMAAADRRQTILASLHSFASNNCDGQ